MAQWVSGFWVLQDIGRAMILSGGSGEVADSKLIPVVSRTWFLVVVGLMSPFPCQLGTAVDS